MGKEKAGFMTPKAIANRIKSKGLQKLRWYCQMCMKQCRDENGFKCHLSSESHQRQLLLFAENPDQYIDTFSQEFLDFFLELLRRRFGTKRVRANQVYQEYIADREHTHMNSTQWETLTDFVKWMGKEGHCVVDETEKGWFVQYIDRNPEAIQRQEALQKKEKMDMDDEEKMAKFIEQQVEKAGQNGKEIKDTEFTELQRENEEEKVVLKLGMKEKKYQTTVSSKLATVANPLKVEPAKVANPLKGEAISQEPSTSKGAVGGQKRKSALDDIMKMEEQKKEKQKRKDYWLCRDIVVKIITKKLGSKYYKKKAVVMDVPDRFVGIIKVLETGDRLKIDQEHVETVIPDFGKPVIIVNGAYRGQDAVLESINESKFTCSIKLISGMTKGRVIDGIQYEDVCKLATKS